MNNRILFIGPGYANYDRHILREMQEKYDVTYFCFAFMDYYHPRWNSFLNMVKMSDVLCYLNRKYIDYQIGKIKDAHFDKVFILKGDYLSNSQMTLLKELYPSAEFILYLWDDIARIGFFNGYLNYFDKILSFDSEDCKRYGFIHRPLFYLENKIEKVPKYVDISFVGTEHSERLNRLRQIKNICVKYGLTYSFKMITSKSRYICKKIFKSKYDSDEDIFCTKSVPYKQYLQILNGSKAVVDFPFPSQSGLTMRTIESLSLGVKIITSNKSISDYVDIPTYMYYILNQDVIDGDKLRLFIEKPIDSFTLPERYTLKKFVEEIIN